MSVKETRDRMNAFGEEVKKLVDKYRIDTFVASLQACCYSEGDEPIGPADITGVLRHGSLDNRLVLVGQLIGLHRGEVERRYEEQAMNKTQKILSSGQNKPFDLGEE